MLFCELLYSKILHNASVATSGRFPLRDYRTVSCMFSEHTADCPVVSEMDEIKHYVTVSPSGMSL